MCALNFLELSLGFLLGLLVNRHSAPAIGQRRQNRQHMQQMDSPVHIRG
jgi:hypothetical protein